MVRKLIITISPFMLMVVFLLPAQNASAVDIFDRGVCNNGRASNATVCKDRKVGNDNPISGPNGVLMSIVNLLTIVVGIAAVIMIILGGLKFITSGSNPEEVKTARERIIYAIVALIIAALAQVIVRVILSTVVN